METRQLICTGNQLTGLYMRAKLAINGLMRNTTGNVLLGHVGVSYIFLRLHLIMGGTSPTFEDDVAIFSSNPMQHLRCSCFRQKISNSCKVLLTVVTESFALIVRRLLDPTLKHIDKHRLRQ